MELIIWIFSQVRKVFEPFCVIFFTFFGTHICACRFGGMDSQFQTRSQTVSWTYWFHATCVKFKSPMPTYSVLVGSAPSYPNDLVGAHVNPHQLCSARESPGKPSNCPGEDIQIILIPCSSMVEWPSDVCQGKADPLLIQKALQDRALGRAPALMAFICRLLSLLSSSLLLSPRLCSVSR